jgi:hypothetical protein
MSGRVTLVVGGGGRWFVVLLVGYVIHLAPSLRYSPPVSAKRQDRSDPDGCPMLRAIASARLAGSVRLQCYA